MLPAARLGRYEVLAKLAAGGMGEIFLARLEGKAGFEKLYVIKKILPHLADDVRFRSMMIAEAQIVSKINHANICQIHELDELDGQLYIVMEYLEGITLLELIRRFAKEKLPLDLGLVAGILCQVADGLHYAHELKDREGKPLNIVHRDITPSNVFLTDHGVAKVLDFGIAKIENVANTESGAIKGKYAYMSPEQLRGNAVDRRADIFAMGIMMFEMLSLRRLFQRKTDYLTFRAVLDQPLPDISKFRQDVPDAVLGVMKKCLAGDPEKRFATVRQFRQALVAAVPMPPWGDPEIGDFVLAHFAEEIRKRERNIGAVLHRKGSASSMPTIGGSADPEPDIDYFTPVIEIAHEEPTTNVHLITKAGTTLDDLPKATRRRKTKRMLIPIAAAALLVAGIVIWQVAQTPDEARPGKYRLPPTVDPYVLALRDHQAAFDRCLLSHGSALPPYARVRVFLEPDGFAYDLAFEPPNTVDSSLGGCIRNELRTVRFPAAPTRKQILIALNVR